MDANKIKELERQIAAQKRTIGALITWMVQSANSPIRQDEAVELLKMLEGQ